MRLEDELERVRALQQAAMDAKSAEGATRDGVMVAGLRASLRYAVDRLEPHLTDLEAALGVPLDAATFVAASMAMGMAAREVDAVAAAKMPAPRAVLLEFMERAAQVHAEELQKRDG